MVCCVYSLELEYQILVYCNLETICTVPPHELTVHQVST